MQKGLLRQPFLLGALVVAAPDLPLHWIDPAAIHPFIARKR
ncbi:MAG TPA: hypothetical protein VFE12_13985 [Acetobacteraceae bacterium]|nr:hypothetical protein [Acetobacteraceae bacterium]